jgi:UDP-2,3-diacylglucosamine pyrophosphatase LpxH
MTKEQFTSDLANWNSFLPLLWEALEATTGDVIELGVGEGSTQKLHDYCAERGRNLRSYESNKEWFDKFTHLNSKGHDVIYVGNNWEVMLENEMLYEKIGVLFSDEAPGEMRKYNIAMLSGKAKVVVVHDSEPDADPGYKLSYVSSIFNFALRYEEFPAHATLMTDDVQVLHKVEL